MERSEKFNTIKFLTKKGVRPEHIGALLYSWDNLKKELNEKVFLLYTVIATNVLTEEEFFGDDTKKITAFREECFNLLDAVCVGSTKWQECCDLFKLQTGEEIDLDILSQAGFSMDDAITKETKDGEV